MNGKPEEFLIQAWKQQLDGWMRAVEALTQAATRMREAQLEAATEAHADAVATQKAIAQAKSADELLRLQAEWARANVEKCAAYWGAVCRCTMEANSEVAKCLSAACAALPAEPPKAPVEKRAGA